MKYGKCWHLVIKHLKKISKVPSNILQLSAQGSMPSGSFYLPLLRHPNLRTLAKSNRDCWKAWVGGLLIRDRFICSPDWFQTPDPPDSAPWVQSLQEAVNHIHTTETRLHWPFGPLHLTLKTPPLLFSLPAFSIDPGRGIEDLY